MALRKRQDTVKLKLEALDRTVALCVELPLEEAMDLS